MLLPFDNPGQADSPDMVDPPPLPSGVPLTDGQIIWTCIFTFLPLMGQAADVNDGQTVETVVLDSFGAPVVLGGIPQAASTDGVYPLGSSQYGCAYSCPPPFSGSARATLTSGPNAGQSDTQPINLGAAVDLSSADWTLGPPQTTLLSAISNILSAQSDGAVFVQVTDASGNDLDPNGNPVAMAITPGRPQSTDFQPARWVRVPTPLINAGLYTRLPLSVLDGTALPAGSYRVYVQIDGTTTLRCPGYLSAQD